jgi:hypothetical protein
MWRDDFLGITDLTWIKKTAVGNEIVIVVGVDGKFSGGTLSDPSLTINNFKHKRGLRQIMLKFQVLAWNRHSHVAG